MLKYIIKTLESVKNISHWGHHFYYWTLFFIVKISCVLHWFKCRKLAQPIHMSKRTNLMKKSLHRIVKYTWTVTMRVTALEIIRKIWIIAQKINIETRLKLVTKSMSWRRVCSMLIEIRNDFYWCCWTSTILGFEWNIFYKASISNVFCLHAINCNTQTQKNQQTRIRRALEIDVQEYVALAI